MISSIYTDPISDIFYSSERSKQMTKVVTQYVPISSSYSGFCDWSAVMSDRDDGGAHQIGRGRTKKEAIADLREQIEAASPLSSQDRGAI